jgi:hypothetical protein
MISGFGNKSEPRRRLEAPDHMPGPHLIGWIIEIPMENQRASQRQRILKTGTISFDRAAGINCIVRNVSETGALLEIESPVGIPNIFTLVIAKDEVQRPCHVVWRSARRIGIGFD